MSLVFWWHENYDHTSGKLDKCGKYLRMFKRNNFDISLDFSNELKPVKTMG